MFYFFARTADDVADHKDLKSKEKLRILNFFDKSIKTNQNTDISVLENIVDNFEKYKFSKNQSRKILVAFKLDATKKRYKNWYELLYYCKYSANPVGRFFIDVIYREKNKTIPDKKIIEASDSLCTALQIINHIQDCKTDFIKLNRVYIPLTFFKKYNLSVKILKNSKSPEKFKIIKDNIITKTEHLMKNCQKDLGLIDIWRLKKETLIILNIAKRLCFLLKNNDPLEKKIKLSRIDLIFCFIKGIIWD